MIATTFNNTPVFLLTSEPDGKVDVTVSRLTERHASRTRREERRILGATLRWALSYKTTIADRAVAQQARLALQAFDNRPVLCPLWLAAVPYGQASRYVGALRCTWEPDFEFWELHTTPTPMSFHPSTDAWTAPVLWGRFDAMPDPDLLTTEIPTMQISFVEKGPKASPAAYAVAPAPSVTIHTGPTLHAQEWPLLDFDLDYHGSKAGGVEIQVDRQRIGFGRTEAETYYPQTPRRPVNCSIAGDADEAARLIATFHACGGTVSPLWFPSATSPTRVTDPTFSGDPRVRVEDSSALGGHPYIILRDFSGVNVARRVVSMTAKQLTLDSAPGDFVADDLSLQLLLFGRFQSDELRLSWSSPLVTADFTMIELPADYGAPDGEIYEKTLGNVGAPIFLVETADQVGGRWWWTNYESPIELDGHTYEPKQVTWDKLTERLNLDDGKASLTVEAEDGNPYVRLTLPRRGQQLSVTLREWDASGATPAVRLWSGQASSASRKGKILTVPVTGEGALFDTRVPRRLDGPTCPWVIYGPGCDLNPQAFAVGGTVAGQIAALQLSVAVAGNYPEHYFASGWVERLVAGDGSPTYGILDSSASADGKVIVTVDFPFAPAVVVGEALKLYPGCDQLRTTCQARGNVEKFGGQWRKPAANPAFVAVKQNTAPTSKK